MKILVTGGAGYIGSITTKELLDNGYDVVVLDNMEKGHRKAVDKRAVLEIADLGDKKAIEKILSRHKCDAVIDFAAYIAVGESMEEPVKYLRNNVLNFINLLDCLAEFGPRYLIKSSTAAVYGTPEKDSDLPLNETYTDTHKPAESQLLKGKWQKENVIGDSFFEKILNFYSDQTGGREELKLTTEEIQKLKIQPSVYGLTKMLDEILMKKYDNLSGIKFITLRYFNVAGADPSGNLGQDNAKPTHIFASAIFQLLGKKEKLMIFGQDYATKDGTGIRDYIHVSDLARAHLKALEYLSKKRKSDTFNIGTGIGYSVMDVINAVENASGRKVEYEFASRRSGDVAILLADPGKANEILEWKAKYSLSDMAETSWKWHSTHPNGYQD